MKHLLARQHELHGAPAFLREEYRHGFTVDGDLAAEATADLHRDDLELRCRQAEHRGNHQLRGELPLGGCPHRGKAIGVDLRDHRLRFEITLVRRVDLHAQACCRGSRRKRTLRIAACDDDARADIARGSRPRLNALGQDVVVQHRSIGRHRGRNIEHGRQRLVVHLDQRQRRLGDMRVHGGNGRDRLSDPVDLAARHVDLRHHPHVVAESRPSGSWRRPAVPGNPPHSPPPTRRAERPRGSYQCAGCAHERAGCGVVSRAPFPATRGPRDSAPRR